MQVPQLWTQMGRSGIHILNMHSIRPSMPPFPECSKSLADVCSRMPCPSPVTWWYRCTAAPRCGTQRQGGKGGERKGRGPIQGRQKPTIVEWLVYFSSEESLQHRAATSRPVVKISSPPCEIGHCQWYRQRRQSAALRGGSTLSRKTRGGSCAWECRQRRNICSSYSGKGWLQVP